MKREYRCVVCRARFESSKEFPPCPECKAKTVRVFHTPFLSSKARPTHSRR